MDHSRLDRIGSGGHITIPGSLYVDTDTLYVDSVNDAVWIRCGSINDRNEPVLNNKKRKWIVELIIVEAV